MGIAFDEDILKKMWEEKEPWTVNTFANLAGLTMLDNKEYIKKIWKMDFRRKKNLCIKELSEFQYIKAYKTECNFILIKLTNISSESLREENDRKKYINKGCFKF